MKIGVQLARMEWSVIDGTLDNHAQNTLDAGDAYQHARLQELREYGRSFEDQNGTATIELDESDWAQISDLLANDALEYQEIAGADIDEADDWRRSAEVNIRLAGRIRSLLDQRSAALAPTRALLSAGLDSDRSSLDANYEDAEGASVGELRLMWMLTVAEDDDEDARIALASHPNLPARVRAILSADPSPRVRRALKA